MVEAQGQQGKGASSILPVHADDNVILKQSCSVVYFVDRVNASIAKQMLDLMFEGTLVVIVCMQQNHASVAQ